MSYVLDTTVTKVVNFKFSTSLVEPSTPSCNVPTSVVSLGDDLVTDHLDTHILVVPPWYWHFKGHTLRSCPLDFVLYSGRFGILGIFILMDSVPPGSGWNFIRPSSCTLVRFNKALKFWITTKRVTQHLNGPPSMKKEKQIGDEEFTLTNRIRSEQ